MSELANYSIETDHVVLLSFKDGRNLRVPFKHLAHYLRGGDLDKVKKSINLRRHFLRIHMPRLFVVLAAVGGLVALLSVGCKTIAGLFGHHAPQPAPMHTHIARSQMGPTPQLSSKPVSPAQREVRLTAAGHKVTRSNVASLQPAITPAPAPVVSTPLPPVSQQATPTPVASPTPTPSASPQPTVSPAPAGQTIKPQVLSDSTAPNSGTTTP